MYWFMLIYLVPFSVVFGYLMGGLWTFQTPFFVFAVIPFIDMIIGKDTTNPPEASEQALAAQKSYRIITWFCTPLQLFIIGWGFYVIATHKVTTWELIGLSISTGTCSGIMGINVSHELAHRVNNRMEPFLSKLMLWSVLYLHWGLEHVVGHHRNVATPLDSATARLGESFYTFLPRTIFGTFNTAWEFEANRMKKADLPAWSMQNRVALFLLFQFILILTVAVLFGFRGLVFFLLQSFVAICLLEVVNYIEHYGLLRKKIDDERYETVKPWHSWNSSNWLTNRFLFNLQRHSDHHYKPGRRYQILRHFEKSPQLPTGYAGMIVLAVFPFLWRSIMDPKVKEIQNREQTEEN